MGEPRTVEQLETRFVELSTLVDTASSLDVALARLGLHVRDTLGATRVRAVADDEPPSADDVFSLSDPGTDRPWLHMAISWGSQRRPADETLRACRASLALIMPSLAQRRRLDLAAQHLEDPSVGELGRPERELEDAELRRLLQILLERAIRDAGGDRGAILLVNHAAGRLRLDIAALAGPRHDLSLALRRRRAREELPRPPIFRTSRSGLAAPLLLGGRVAGAVVIESGRPDTFAPAQEERLDEFAESAAALIARTRGHEGKRAHGPGNVLRRLGLTEEAIDLAHAAAARDTPLHLCGEPGSGRETFARYIHRMSGRTLQPFTIVTDAHALRAAAAAVGTVFVNGADLFPQTTQEEIAALVTAAADRRVIAGSSGGPLVEGLARALGDDRIVLPPLRLHPDAIPSAARLMLRETCESRGLPPKFLSAEALEVLLGYPFPGNLRELREVVEIAAAAAEGPVI
ncbi:MAG: AAA-type ATPase lid domain-containing protein, partial [Planctomycetota bacterium]